MKKFFRKMYFMILDFFKSLFSDKKKTAIILGAIAVLLAGGYFGYRYLKPQPKQVYEALIAVRSQNNSDPTEDLRNSLKAGDVLLVLPEGHQWSTTERVSYLILKMYLTEDQAAKIVSPQEKIEMVDLPKEQIEAQKQAGGKVEKEREQRTILRARQYRIKLEELDQNFDPNILLEKQPYLDKIYDWKIVEKKPKV